MNVGFATRTIPMIAEKTLKICGIEGQFLRQMDSINDVQIRFIPYKRVTSPTSAVSGRIFGQQVSNKNRLAIAVRFSLWGPKVKDSNIRVWSQNSVLKPKFQALIPNIT